MQQAPCCEAKSYLDCVVSGWESENWLGWLGALIPAVIMESWVYPGSLSTLWQFVRRSFQVSFGNFRTSHVRRHGTAVTLCLERKSRSTVSTCTSHREAPIGCHAA